jgi:hypothetical protein
MKYQRIRDQTVEVILLYRCHSLTHGHLRMRIEFVRIIFMSVASVSVLRRYIFSLYKDERLQLRIPNFHSTKHRLHLLQPLPLPSSDFSKL